MQSLSPDHKAKPAFSQWLFQPVNNSPLIVFRIIFGSLLFYHFSNALWSGVIYENFIRPPFTFSHIGFEWLQPLPGNGMYYYVGLMLLLALLIILGAWYRLAMISFALLWTILYLMQKAAYNNHYYLVMLLCWIMAFLPANRRCSVDAGRMTVKTDTCSRYCIWIFIAQVAIVYFFAAIAKLSTDWFSGKFMTIQFSRLSTHRFIGVIYGSKWFPLLICYGGFLFDLLVVPLLLWKKTRNSAFFVSGLFHLFNSYTFRIGIFPYLSIALDIFFFDPQRIQRIFSWLVSPLQHTAVLLNRPFQKKIILWIICIYVFFQLLLPTRSWFFPGNVFWTEEGYRLSWKMMLRTKSGTVYFKVIDPASHREWKEDPSKKFTYSQRTWLAIAPDIMWQYAQRLKKEYAQKGFPNVEIYAIGTVSLNRAKPVPLVDTTIDLGKVKWEPFRHSEWITEH